MTRNSTHIPLHVFLNGKLVGYLRKSTSGAIDFQYDQSWLSWEHAMPISLSLPLREDRFIGEPVVAVFENLLPDNKAIRKHVAGRVGAASNDAYSLLSAIGRDCVGALQFLPEDQSHTGIEDISGSPLTSKEIAEIINNLGTSPLGLTEDQDFRLSIAGAQEKTALLFWQTKWYKPHGTTPTTHIIKPAMGVIQNGIDMTHSVENEFFCMTFLSNLGMPVAKTSIEDFSGTLALVVERFDRKWTENDGILRLPQEDCCQALSVSPDIKYESDGGPSMKDILGLLKGSDTPEEDQKTFLKAQILFWLLAATDGHAKNYSVFIGAGGRYHMTPIYDVLSAQPCFDAGQISKNKMKLAMAVGNNRHYVIHTITLRHFIQTAKSVGIPESTVIDIATELYASIPDALGKTKKNMPTGFPKDIVESISDGVMGRAGGLKA